MEHRSTDFENPEVAGPPARDRRGPRSWFSVLRWIVFYIGFFLSPLTPGNDAIINQLPSALLATAFAGGRDVPGYETLYIGFYILTNVLGLLLMLVNYPEIRRKWDAVLDVWRGNPKKLIRMVIVDLLTFAVIFLLGRILLSSFS